MMSLYIIAEGPGMHVLEHLMNVQSILYSVYKHIFTLTHAAFGRRSDPETCL